jgi:hypothetical protein
MRFLKRQSTNLRSLSGKGVHFDTNDQIIMDSNNSIRLPKGSTTERPFYPTDGHLRYNTTTDEVEAYQDGAWRKLRFKEPNRNPGIVQQTFGPGDAIETAFGILNSGDADYPIPATERNILVFVENVYQIPGTNYSLVQNPPGKAEGWYIEFGTAVPFGKDVTVIHNFDK